MDTLLKSPTFQLLHLIFSDHQISLRNSLPSTSKKKPRSLADRERGRSNENAEVHLPSQEQCIAHLKLLETFHQLKEDIGTTDGLFGISNRLADGNSQQEAVLTKIAEKRWAIYVARAADRFEQWWQSSIPASTFRPSGPIEQQYMAYDNRFEFESLVDRCWPMQFDEHRLPPIGMFEVFGPLIIRHPGLTDNL